MACVGSSRGPLYRWSMGVPMKLVSVAALPLIGLLALPGSSQTNSVAGLAPAVTIQADRLVAVQSRLGLQVDPYNIPVMSIGLPRTADAVPMGL